MLPGEDRHFARVQPDPGETPQKAAKRHLLPDVRRAAFARWSNLSAANACPTVTATPETVKAAFTKENNVFAEINLKYIDSDPQLRRPQTFRLSDVRGLDSPILGLSPEENDRAVEVGYAALRRLRKQHSQARPPGSRPTRARRPHRHRHARRALITTIPAQSRNPGGIPEARLSRSFSQSTLPIDEDMLEQPFR